MFLQYWYGMQNAHIFHFILSQITLIYLNSLGFYQIKFSKERNRPKIMELDNQNLSASQVGQTNEQVHYDYDDQQQNLTPQPKTYENNYEEKPEIQLQNLIMENIKSQEKEEDLISKQLEIKLQRLIEKILFSQENQEEKLKLRMHQLALSKILVNTHGKTQFYLVKAHHHLGQAYLNYKCYEQALDHLTMSLKKNAKINDMNEIKLYHSYVLTTYSRCYYEISSFDDALQILKKAHDIQLGCSSENKPIDNIETLKLISNCYLKLKKYNSSLQFISKVLSKVQQKNGKNSKQYAKTKIQMSKVLICEQGKQKQAILMLQSAIGTFHDIKYQNQLQIADYYQLLATFYQKINDHKNQIQSFYKKYQIYSEIFEEGHEKTLKVKKNIAFLLQKYKSFTEAIKQLQQVLESQEKFYPQNRVQIGKTLKALGLCYMSMDYKLNQAQNYLKRAQKMLAEHGIPKSIKQIKIKLQEIKEKRQNKAQNSHELKSLERQIEQHPIEMAH